MLYTVNLVGRVGTDAETVSTGTTQFIRCRVAVDDNNGKEKSTRWVSLGLNYEKFKNMAQYLTKGKLVYVTGTERVRAYSGKDGVLGVDTTVWVDKIEFISTGQKQEGSTDNAAAVQTTTVTSKDAKNSEMTVTSTKKSMTKTEPVPVQEEVPQPIPDDDLPF